ncbi:MAG: C1 family peptidase, partial [Bdellovibrionota bacterium]
GSLNLGERIIDEHGLVPAGVWSPRIPFEKAEFSGRFMTFINQRIAQFHLAAAKNPELRTNLLEDAKTDLRILFESYIGEAPQKFTFDGVEYSSPKDFAQRFLPPKTTTTNRIYLEKEADLPKSLAEAEPKSGPSNGAFNQVKIFKVHYKNEEDFEKVVIAAIKEGKTVSIATEMAREFIDHKTGIMSVKAFHTPPGFEPVPKNYRGAFGLTGGGHLMEIVGVDVDEAGRVIKYKIKNSWGVEAGDKGFYHMYPDYLRHYVQYIDIP